jgi:hypothetical protein
MIHARGSILGFVLLAAVPLGCDDDGDPGGAGPDASAPADAAVADAVVAEVDAAAPGDAEGPVPVDAGADAAITDAAITDAAITDAPSATDAAAPGPRLVLAELAFSDLPINSVRAQVRGVDRAAGMCAAVVWDYSNTGHKTERHCDDFGTHFPYVVIESGGTCGGVYYAGNVEVLGARGCIDFARFSHPGATNFVDVTVDVRSPLFTGTIVLRTP